LGPEREETTIKGKEAVWEARGRKSQTKPIAMEAKKSVEHGACAIRGGREGEVRVPCPMEEVQRGSKPNRRRKEKNMDDCFWSRKQERKKEGTLHRSTKKSGREIKRRRSSKRQWGRPEGRVTEKRGTRRSKEVVKMTKWEI